MIWISDQSNGNRIQVEIGRLTLTSNLAAVLARIKVNHHTAAPMGSVISKAVPATVPAKRKGQINNA